MKKVVFIVGILLMLVLIYFMGKGSEKKDVPEVVSEWNEQIQEEDYLDKHQSKDVDTIHLSKDDEDYDPQSYNIGLIDYETDSQEISYENMKVADAVADATNLMGKNPLVLKGFICKDYVSFSKEDKTLAILRIKQYEEDGKPEEGGEPDYDDVFVFLDVTNYTQDLKGKTVDINVNPDEYQLMDIPDQYNDTLFDSTFLITTAESNVQVR